MVEKEILLHKDQNNYLVSKMFPDSIEILEDHICSFFDEEHLLLNSRVIFVLLQKLDQMYSKTLSNEELDERHFISGDSKIQTPYKLTPFARKGEMN